MDAKLRGELQRIGRDRRSGAAELALRATTALEAWLRRHRAFTERELLDVARALLRAQPSMAPLLRLANEVALAVDAGSPVGYLQQACKQYRHTLRRGPQRIPAFFAQYARRQSLNVFVTYSYSSTVMKALLRARAHVVQVICSESRPGYEGRRTAAELARAGVDVCFYSDVALLSGYATGNAVLGADAISDTGFINKVGTWALVQHARRTGRRVWVLADSTKFWPDYPVRGRFLGSREGPSAQLWGNRARGVRVFNVLFDYTPFEKGIRVVTEQGCLTPSQVSKVVNGIRLSPRLRELVD